MKKIIALLSVLLPLCISAQVSFSFEDGSAGGWIFNAADRWNTDNVNPLNGLYSLHHVFDNSEAATDVAVFSIAGLCPDCSETTWEFTVRHGADPSSSNKWSFILASDTGTDGIITGAGFSGFAAGVNFSGYDDTLRLWHILEGKVNVLISTEVNWQNDIGTDGVATIKVTRLPGGEWTMLVESWGTEPGAWGMEHGAGSVKKGAWSKEHEEKGKEGNENSLWKYAGISYTYTSTRDRLLWIDDVSVDGLFIADTLPPSVVSVTASAPDILRVAFNEEPEQSSLLISNISLTGAIEVSSVIKITPEVYELHLNSKISNRIHHTLSFGILCDPAGNCSSAVTEDFVPVYGVTGDVVITEIMADPSPPVQLPDEEYLELTNMTADSLSLRCWILIADNDTANIPDVWIKAGEQVILCSPPDTFKFSESGRVIGVPGFPSLNDTGETLSVRDSRGGLIHAVTYSKSFYKDEWRSGGGWSMEMTDNNNPFNAPAAWRASTDPSGGTPGRPNSATVSVPDTRCPEVIAVYPADPGRVRIVFDETVMGVFAGDEWKRDGVSGVSAVSDDIADRAFVITFAEPIVPGRIYTLQLPLSAADFSGMAPCVTTAQFGIPELPNAGEILFNEILFDPMPPCSDYIELYNNSDRIIDLSLLFLSGSTAEEKGSPVVSLTPVPRQLLPGKYVALTTAKNAVAENYTCSDEQAIYEVRSLPSMPDDEGRLVLLDRALNILDRFDYSSSMHMDFLRGTEGIALEKVAPELSSCFPYNWHSASETCNWGTPGVTNSVLISETEEVPGLNLSSKRVSPDGDGFEDVISVRVIPGGSDNVVTVTVINERGYVVRRLAERFFAGSEALFVWDGTGDDGKRLNAGLYMIMSESYNSLGQTRRWKKVCALLYR